MLLQEILHLSPCPKHGIDNPHDQCKTTHEFLMYQASVDTEYLLGNSHHFPTLGFGSKCRVQYAWTFRGCGEWLSTWLWSDNPDDRDTT